MSANIGNMEGHTPENDPNRYASIEKAVEALNGIVNIDSSAVKVLMENVKVPCVAEMEDVKGITVKTEGWGNKHQVHLTPLGLINVALSAATGNKVAVEFDDDNRIKFVME